MSATGGHQLAAPALLRVLLHPLLRRALLGIMIMGSTLALPLIVLETQGLIVHA